MVAFFLRHRLPVERPQRRAVPQHDGSVHLFAARGVRREVGDAQLSERREPLELGDVRHAVAREVELPELRQRREVSQRLQAVLLHAKHLEVDEALERVVVDALDPVAVQHERLQPRQPAARQRRGVEPLDVVVLQIQGAQRAERRAREGRVHQLQIRRERDPARAEVELLERGERRVAREESALVVRRGGGIALLRSFSSKNSRVMRSSGGVPSPPSLRVPRLGVRAQRRDAPHRVRLDPVPVESQHRELRQRAQRLRPRDRVPAQIQRPHGVKLRTARGELGPELAHPLMAQVELADVVEETPPELLL